MMNEYADLVKERDLLRAEVEMANKVGKDAWEKHQASQSENARLRRCLEYIELTGNNLGHINHTNPPCGCGSCMANEATKALGDIR